MILLDTNILIEILKGDSKTVEKVKYFNDFLYISSISKMELFYGALNKAELLKIEKFLHLFEAIEISESISKRATKLIKIYAKSHGLDIPDALIASCAIENNLKLFTYNIKDFKFIENLQLIEV